MFIYIALFFCLGSVPALAGDFEDALAAHDEGRYDDALTLLKPLAEAGNVDAQNRLSHMYWYGEGTDIDYAAALGWSRRAADAGSAAAHYDIGVHYRRGNGVPQSDTTAFGWYLKSAELGDERGAFVVAIAYGAGTGVEQDTAQFVHWMEVAVERDDPAAKLVMGRTRLMMGDIARADALLQSAAAKRLPQAELLLGRLFLDGEEGWTRDAGQALLWLKIADHAGCLEAPALISRAEAQISPAERDKLAELAETWEVANPFELGRVHPPKPQSCDLQPRSDV